MDQFKDTLASGMRLVLFLTIPSAVGLIALSTPIVSLVYQHHALTPIGTARAATALVGYSFQIPFVGVDQMLIFAFYARRDTLTPMLVGVLGVTTYLISAWLLSPRFGILGLALANTLQNSLHALVLLVLLTAAVGGLSGRGLVPSIARSLLAAVVMGTGAASLSALIRAHVTSTHLAGQAATALVPLAFALILYVGTTALLRSPELAFARDIALRKRPVDG